MIAGPVASPSYPKLGVGAVIWNDKGDIVLIKRGKPPRLNEWSIPGGHVEWGETLKDAIMREVREETGLEVKIEALIDVVDSVSRGDDGAVARHDVLVDFFARHVAGQLCAGSDACEAHWIPYAKLGEVKLWNETRRIIDESARLYERVKG